MIILAVVARTCEPRLENFILCEHVIFHPTLSAVNRRWIGDGPFPVDEAFGWTIPFNRRIYWKVLSQIVFDYVVVLIAKTHAWLHDSERPSIVLQVLNIPCYYIWFVFYLFSLVKALVEVGSCSWGTHIWINVARIVQPLVLIEYTFEAVICLRGIRDDWWNLGINSEKC